MIVSDVMTRNVISVAPDDAVEAAVSLMLRHRISGLLVVDGDRTLAGILTEGDLLRRDELGTQRHRPWWLRLLASPSQQATDFVQAHGRHVRDVMTADVLSVPEDAPLEDVVALMEQHSIKRVPVTQREIQGTRQGGTPGGTQVVGIVSRSDLLRALVGRSRGAAPVTQDDRAIRAQILDALQAQPWAPATTLSVTVADGVVDLWGTVSNQEERHGIRVLAENTPGVRRVNDHVVTIEPYSGTVIEAPDEAP